MLKSLKHLVLGAVLAIPAGLILSAWADGTPNPTPNPKDTHVDPCTGATSEVSENGLSDSKCSKCDCSSCLAADGSTITSNGCLHVKIAAGVSPLGQVPAGTLVLYAEQPSASVFTPAHLVYDHKLAARLDSVTTSGLAQGVACQVVMETPLSERITYQFATGSSIGYPTGKFSLYPSMLTMCDAAGAPVTSSPAQFRLGTRSSQAVTVFSATSPYPACRAGTAPGWT
jgi:hypothetical protein